MIWSTLKRGELRTSPCDRSSVATDLSGDGSRALRFPAFRQIWVTSLLGNFGKLIQGDRGRLGDDADDVIRRQNFAHADGAHAARSADFDMHEPQGR